MKCVNNSDAKDSNKSQTRVCAFCGGIVKYNESGIWECQNCGFWYNKLMEVKSNDK